jgi:hypothetical protein
MGLDQHLTARKYVSNWIHSNDEKGKYFGIVEALDLTPDDLDGDYPTLMVEVPVAYWRKASQIHDWFVYNVQEGDDDCRDYRVPREQLEDLYQLCVDVLESPRKAKKLLPIGDHYHSSRDSYDEWYFEEITNTKTMLRKLLDNQKFMCYDFYYSSSW